MSADTHRPDADPPSALPRGTRLGEFELLHVLGVGGFGIVYLAMDHALEREVAVKEYMPASLAGRTETLHVSLRSQSDAETFSLGLKSFVNEARLLARFDHPSLVKVHRFWEANGTAYMAMPVYRGRTLKEVRAGMAMPPDEAWLRSMLVPLLGAIERLHGEGVYHRDIAPDNIQIEADGRPVLLDFGAARRVITDKSQALTAILKPAYAPIEQYGEAGSVRQGPWTDLYALGATLHYLLLGRPPAPATARAVHDDVLPLAQQALAGCSTDFLQTIDWMLAPRPTDRPQSVAALREVLDGRVPPPQRLAPPAAPAADWERTQAWPATAPRAPREADPDSTVVRPTRPGSAVPSGPPPAVPPAVPPAPTVVPPSRAHQAAPAGSPPAAPVKTGTSMLVPALLGGAAVLAAAAWFFWPRPAAEGLTDGRVAASAAAPAAASAPDVTAGTPAPVAAPAPTETATPSAMTAPPAQATPTTTAASALPVRPPPKPAAPRPAAPTVTLPATTSPPVESAPTPAPPPPAVAASAPVAVPAPAPALPAVTPADRCGSRLLLALWRCMERECKTPELRSHPECVKWRAEEQRRQRDPSQAQ